MAGELYLFVGLHATFQKKFSQPSISSSHHFLRASAIPLGLFAIDVYGRFIDGFDSC